jgi:hypothetical protein
MKRPGAVQLLGGVQELPHEDARLALGEGPNEQVAEARADQLHHNEKFPGLLGGDILDLHDRRVAAARGEAAGLTKDGRAVGPAAAASNPLDSDLLPGAPVTHLEHDAAAALP